MDERCPTSPRTPDGTPHAIIGCGSSNVVQDPDEPAVWDCLDCGIWFTPAEEALRAGYEEAGLDA